MVVALDEVFDNSIRANATKITLELVQSGDRGVVGLVCRDDGVSGFTAAALPPAAAGLRGAAGSVC